MFINDAQLGSFVLSAIQKTGGTLESYWPAILTQSNLRAYNEIVGQLSARGFSAAQIAAWDRGAEFQKSLGAYFAFTVAKANNPEQYSLEAIKTFDVRNELRGNEREGIPPVVVLNSGEFQWPEGPQGLPSTGPIDGTGDLFGTPIDPDDPRIGEPVRT